MLKLNFKFIIYILKFIFSDRLKCKLSTNTYLKYNFSIFVLVINLKIINNVMSKYVIYILINKAMWYIKIASAFR